jgi:hypothetical protein
MPGACATRRPAPVECTPRKGRRRVGRGRGREAGSGSRVGTKRRCRAGDRDERRPKGREPRPSRGAGCAAWPGGRKRVVFVRLSPEEEAWIVSKAAAEGHSVQRFLVESAMPEGRPSLLARRALYREFFAPRTDLHGACTNLNQLADLGNQRRAVPTGVEASAAEVKAAMERLVRLAGLLVAHPKSAPGATEGVIAKVTRGDQPREAVGYLFSPGKEKRARGSSRRRGQPGPRRHRQVAAFKGRSEGPRARSFSVDGKAQGGHFHLAVDSSDGADARSRDARLEVVGRYAAGRLHAVSKLAAVSSLCA